MQYTCLPHLPRQSSVLGFGCSALLGRTGRKDSLRALEAAYDGGINFFDIARSYGYGESESLLGSFLRGKRDRVIISTKFGILPKRSSWWKHAMKPLVRQVLDIAPGARTLVRKQVKREFEEGMFSARVLRASLEESLRELQTDHVDFLFAHSAPLSILDNEELLREFERAVELGKVRVAGISASSEIIGSFIKHRPSFLRAFQFPCNIFEGRLLKSLENDQTPGLILVANHPFGGVSRVADCRRILRTLPHHYEVPETLKYKLRQLDDQGFADIVLNTLRRARIDIVVPAMMQRRHIDSNIRAIDCSQFTSSELDWIRTLWLTIFDNPLPIALGAAS